MGLLILAACSSDPVANFETTFTPQEELRFGKGNPDLVISAISNIVVASDGLMLVSDGRTPAIYRFDTQGNFLGGVGDLGTEPGQFDAPPSISLFENDSLFAWDRSLMRGSIFARSGDDWTFARSFQLPLDAGDGYMIGALSKLKGLEGYITSEVVPGLPDSSRNNDPRYRIVSENGEALNPSFLSRRSPEIFVDTSTPFGTMFQLPFGRSSLVRFEDGGTYYLAPWNEDLKIDQYDASGNRIGGIDIETAKRDVTDVDKQFNPQAGAPGVAEHIPATHPAFVAFVVSDKGNYWVNIGQTDLSTVFWAVYAPSGDLLGTTSLPATVRPVRIIDGKMYAASQSSAAEPEVVVYSVDY